MPRTAPAPVPTAKPIQIPRYAADWFQMVQDDPDISPAVKQGRKRLHVAHTTYKSGSKIRRSEFIHLRAFWPDHGEGVETFDHYMRDNLVEGYAGYVSPQNVELAGNICRNLSAAWHTYHGQVEAGKSGFASDPKGGVWAMVHGWQALVGTHTRRTPSKFTNPAGKDAGEDEDDDDDDDEGTASIYKRGYVWRPDSTNTTTSTFTNVQIATPDSKSRRAEPLHGTPRAQNLERGKPGPGNAASVDEMYANMSLLLFLQATTMEAAAYLGTMNWLPVRLTLKLEADTLPYGAQNAAKVELMKALVDGYLCRRTGDCDFSRAPLAICEAKPFVRDSNPDKIQRQETAEMAAWIAQHASSGHGLLQSSTSGRKRRLLLSQDRHEMYIIIGEYGQDYEDYITGKIDLQGTTSSANDAGSFDAEENERDAAGSRAYARQAKLVKDDHFTPPPAPPPAAPPAHAVVVVGGGGGRGRAILGAPSGGRNTRSRSRAGQGQSGASVGTGLTVVPKASPQQLPPAGEFLIMHQFGPYVIYNGNHMDRLLRRVMAMMLQLRQDRDVGGGFHPPPPSLEFLNQPIARTYPRRTGITRHPSEEYGE